MRRIKQQIVGYRVEKDGLKDDGSAKQETGAVDESLSGPEAAASADVRKLHAVERMHEGLQRPPRLKGTTYKIKTPVSDHAMYVTINDIVLGEGTDNERRRPFEIFINSKNLDHYQWIVALTRVMSAVFRKGGEVAFLVEELKAIFDPRGGYWQPGGTWMPSVIAELGTLIGEHFEEIGLYPKEALDAAQRDMLESKRQDYENEQRQQDVFAESKFPPGAGLCGRCHTAAVIVMDGCPTCLNCGDSKCN